LKSGWRRGDAAGDDGSDAAAADFFQKLSKSEKTNKNYEKK
jgi:hypothetical protein